MPRGVARPWAANDVMPELYVFSLRQGSVQRQRRCVRPVRERHVQERYWRRRVQERYVRRRNSFDFMQFSGKFGVFTVRQRNHYVTRGRLSLRYVSRKIKPLQLWKLTSR